MSKTEPINTKCDTCLRICDITNAMCRACHDGSNWIECLRREAPAAQTARSCDTCSYVSVFPPPQRCNDCDDDLSGYAPSAVFDEERIDTISQNGNDGLHYGEPRLNAFGLPYAQAAMNALYRDMLDNKDVANGPELKIKSDGSTARYYELPDGATELQDLISFKNMNSQIGEIFRACYRYGEVEHSDKLRDAKKIKFYAEAEIARLEKYESTDGV